MNQEPANQGFIKIAIVIVVVVVILGILQVDLRSIMESEGVQANLQYAGELLAKLWAFLVMAWEDYLKGPATSIWEFILTSLNNRPQ